MTVGVYASPNRSLAEFEQLLVEVGALIGQASPNPVLVAGDFNAKSTAWGSPATDARGEALEEWAVSLGLAVINSPRWSLGRLDSQLAKEAAIVEAWCAGTEPVAQVDREADQLGAALFRICDVAMPRVKPQAPRRRVYWWRPELRQLRRACVAARRQYARSRRRRVRDRDLEATFYTAYRDACDQLKKAIAQAKEDAWREWLATLESDPWGRPYRVVRQKLRPWTPPLSSTLQPHVLERVLSVLFPERGEFVPPSMAPLRPSSEVRDLAPPVTEAELCAAVHKLRSKRTAPGPDGIPGRALSIALDALGDSVRQLFSACLAQGRFPHRWKTGKLVLIRKEGRAPDQPSAYRPIVLLDEVSKLFERVLAVRLVDSMEPGLNERQYGFRPGRSTLDAIAKVRDLAEEEVTQGGVLLAVSLDIANAFNSLPWEVILEALHYHNVPGYLRRTIADYFSGRAVVFPTQDGFGRRVMTCGVPQGSVLGPLLWNIGTHREAAYLATAGVAHAVHRIRALGLEVALHKSEALAFHGPRNAPPPGMVLTASPVTEAELCAAVLKLRSKRTAPGPDGIPGRALAIASEELGDGMCQLFSACLAQARLVGSMEPGLSEWQFGFRRGRSTLDAVARLREVAEEEVSRGGVLLAVSLDISNAFNTLPWEVVLEALRYHNVPDYLRRTIADYFSGRAVVFPTMEGDSRRAMTCGVPQGSVLGPLLWNIGYDWVLRGATTHREAAYLATAGVAHAVHRIRALGLEVALHKSEALVFHGPRNVPPQGMSITAARASGNGPLLREVQQWREEARRRLMEKWEDRLRVPDASGELVAAIRPVLREKMVASEEAWAALRVFSEAVMSAKEEAERQREDDPNSLPLRRRRPGRRRRDHLGRLL
ncbi:uncharacterized protein LOC124540911 [Vanessa cardui]|uniref:uncharacterized protein LOC124540911 n=1 Tax=Vanessa cardui TaxID=171605 RepID=UPI001F1369CB|nr:uncharacterized protein LOC124540911 [Vanessa cardui]